MNQSQTLGFKKRPSLEEKIHCVAFVLDAVKISAYHESLSSSFQQLREHISELGEKAPRHGLLTCSLSSTSHTRVTMWSCQESIRWLC